MMKNPMIGIVRNLENGQAPSAIGFDRTYSLGDHIAFDQFLLAIERNLLLHVTTALNTTVVGFAMLRFFSRNPNDLYSGLGFVAFGLAGVIFSKGVRDWLRMRRILARIPPEIREQS